ncbi:hypothetical protein AMECASPLE_034864 [Ameca splendens]|uniref:Secreted protein n=1 Tax=Ameca splendens TaxID=208324 RepID=A0ABV0YIP3_9TELE
MGIVHHSSRCIAVFSTVGRAAAVEVLQLWRTGRSVGLWTGLQHSSALLLLCLKLDGSSWSLPRSSTEDLLLTPSCFCWVLRPRRWPV